MRLIGEQKNIILTVECWKNRPKPNQSPIQNEPTILKNRCQCHGIVQWPASHQGTGVFYCLHGSLQRQNFRTVYQSHSNR